MMRQVTKTHRRMSGLTGRWEGRGRRGRRRNSGKIKLQQKQKKAKSPKKGDKKPLNRLSFRSEEEEKEYAQRIDQEGKSLRGATDRSDLSFPKEMVQREAEEGSEVEWEIQAVEVPMVL